MKVLVWSLVFGVALVEILALSFRLNFWRRRANALEHAALGFAETSDERTREKLILKAAWNLLGLVVYVWGILALFFLVVSVFPDHLKLQDSVFLLMTSVVFMTYAWLRAHLRERRERAQVQVRAALRGSGPTAQFQSSYNRIARWLHWMALEIGTVRSASFELEKVLFLKKAARDTRIADQPVYVVGLARSGTTVVLEILDKTGAFHSPTYRDMPFVLCPNLWQGLTRHARLNAQLANRAHGDGIIVGFDSPESFEEVFWRTACNPEPGSVLAYAPVTQDVMDDFAAYRKLSVLSALPSKPRPHPAPQSLRYLSKNNNNVMRINELSAQPGAHVVLIVRDPLATAWSLYRQHQRFGRMQTDDAFVRAYMRWLGHHEFGQGHKPLVTGVQHLQGLNPSQPDYWLSYWFGIHQNLWKSFHALHTDQRARVIWMSHEHMCNAPAPALAQLFRFVQIEQTPDPYIAMLRTAETQDLAQHFDPGLIQRARLLHQQIIEYLTHEQI